MKRGDVAISHVIAIVLGMIVLGVIIYFLYQNITNTQIDCQRCAAELTSWCARCYMSNWGRGPGMSDYLESCIVECNLASSPYTCDTAQSFCNPYVPF